MEKLEKLLLTPGSLKKRRKSQAVPQMKGRRQQELYEIYGMGDIEHTVVKQCLYISFWRGFIPSSPFFRLMAYNAQHNILE